MASLPHDPVRLAIIGLGGYAATHHLAVLRLESARFARLVTTCDPDPKVRTRQAADWRFMERGVTCHADYQTMLAEAKGKVDAVIIPTPIALHAEMHATAVQAGFPVYLEKPPTLDPAELVRMEAAEAGARFATQVGFNFIIQPQRRALKRRLLAGEFGVLREVRFTGLWQRTENYFRRNGWAAQLFTPDGRLLLDSCFANAMAHFVHNTLHWAGAAALDDWVEPAQVRAALFRAHDIAGADTFLVESVTHSGVILRLGMSHACQGPLLNREEIHCTDAVIHYDVQEGIEVVWRDGRREVCAAECFDPVADNLRAYCDYLRGAVSRPATRLSDCRPFVMLNGLSYVAAGSIHDLAACGARVERVPEPGGSHYRPVADMPAVIEAFVQTGVWPRHWSGSAGGAVATPPDLEKLTACVRDMSSRSTVGHSFRK